MATEDRRSAIVDPDFIVVMKPSGRLYPCEYATNLSGGAIQIEDGKPRLRGAFRDAGFRTLDEIADNEGQKAFWHEYFAEGRRRRGIIEPLGEDTVAEMTPAIAKEAAMRANAPATFDGSKYRHTKKPEAKPEPEKKAKAPAS